MKTLNACAIFLCLPLLACASNNDLHAPKSLPDNWKTQGHYMDAVPLRDDQIPPAMRNNAEATSLWSSSPKSLFGDRRASQYGDILTVVIEIDDEAEIKNSIAQNRQSDQDFSLNAFFGLPEIVNKNLPNGASLSPAVDFNRASNINGNGTIKREEKMTLRLAARVVEILPNGYLNLAGRQEIMVNNEIRYLQVTGLVRTQDISRLNTITYDKIAEARIYYGGQGQITNTVKPRVGNKIISKVLPF